MADRIAVMNRGRIEQFAPPSEIYDRPATLFVNRFVGTANVVPAHAAPAWAAQAPAGAVVCVRPEQLCLARQAGARSLAATVKAVMPLGPQVIYEVQTAGGLALRISSARSAEAAEGPRPGDAVHVEPAPGAQCRVFMGQDN